MPGKLASLLHIVNGGLGYSHGAHALRIDYGRRIFFAADGFPASGWRDKCAAIGGCLSIWPVVNGSARPILGPGVKRSLVGTITVMRKKRSLGAADNENG